MPAYICAIPPKTLNNGQKDQIAAAIGRRHSEATGAPAFFVQVVIEERDTTRRYIGGELSDTHIWIRGDIRSGRPEAVRSALMLAIMKDVSAIAGIPRRRSGSTSATSSPRTWSSLAMSCRALVASSFGLRAFPRAFRPT